MTTTYRLGCIRDSHDDRDLRFEAPEHALHSLPSQVSLIDQCPPVYDQGNLGSCTANAIAAAFEFDLRKQGLADFMPSRLFIYYYERFLEHTMSEDAGASLRDGMKVINKFGVCPETDWPYDIQRFAVEPSQQARVDAAKERAIAYRRIRQSTAQMKACLASGFGFVFGINVYQSFMDANDGNIPMPAPNETLLGGHALLCVGYDDATQRCEFRNSWGLSWGKQGYGTIPYAYLTSAEASDFWQIAVLSKPQ